MTPTWLEFPCLSDSESYKRPWKPRSLGHHKRPLATLWDACSPLNAGTASSLPHRAAQVAVRRSA